MITTFPIVYVVRVSESGRHRIAGFVGLYNLDIGRSLQVSLAIFHPDDRHRGYGPQALTLLLQALQSNRVVKTVGVEVLKVNVASLHFCQKLGFAVCQQNEESFVLEKSIEE
jgi:RimJ/RimL family protein N-acetyltransferase